MESIIQHRINGLITLCSALRIPIFQIFNLSSVTIKNNLDKFQNMHITKLKKYFILKKCSLTPTTYFYPNLKYSCYSDKILHNWM